MTGLARKPPSISLWHGLPARSHPSRMISQLIRCQVQSCIPLPLRLYAGHGDKLLPGLGVFCQGHYRHQRNENRVLEPGLAGYISSRKRPPLRVSGCFLKQESFWLESSRPPSLLKAWISRMDSLSLPWHLSWRWPTKAFFFQNWECCSSCRVWPAGLQCWNRHGRLYPASCWGERGLWSTTVPWLDRLRRCA